MFATEWTLSNHIKSACNQGTPWQKGKYYNSSLISFGKGVPTYNMYYKEIERTNAHVKNLLSQVYIWSRHSLWDANTIGIYIFKEYPVENSNALRMFLHSKIAIDSTILATPEEDNCLNPTISGSCMAYKLLNCHWSSRPQNFQAKTQLPGPV